MAHRAALEAGVCEPLDSGVMVVTGASTPHCMAVASASLMLHMGITPGLAVVEMHQGSSLTKSVKLVSERTSQKVASTSLANLAYRSSCFMAILVHQSLYFQANPSHSWASSCLSWALAQVTFCSYIRAGLRLGSSLVCELSSQ